MSPGVSLLPALLRESGRADNTLVIFLSDHGAHIGGSKLTNYEAGLKVPFILHARGLIRAWQEQVGDFLLDPAAVEREKEVLRENIKQVFSD